MLSLAARSSSAHMVSTAACGWLGARQARAGPMLLRIAVCSLCWLGMLKTYGIGGMPPPPGPPVPQDCDCQAVMRAVFLRRNFHARVRGGPRAGDLQFRIALQHDAHRLAAGFLGEFARWRCPSDRRTNLLPKPPPMWSW